MIYHIYSDYSLTATGASYAYVVVQVEGSKRTIFAFGSRKLKVQHPCHVGEAMGAFAGIRRVPDGERALVHTDMKLAGMLRSRKKRTKRALRRQIAELKEQRQRLQSLDWLFLKKKQRPPAYHWCHRMARSRLDCVTKATPADLRKFTEQQAQSFATRPSAKKKKKKKQKKAVAKAA